MKKNILEFLLIMFGCYFFSYVQIVLDSGFKKFDTFVLPIFSMLYFGLIINAIYFIAYKLVKSRLLFLILSWLTVILFLFRSIEGAKNIELTSIKFHQVIYEEGSITWFGSMYEIIDPFLMMALFATYLFVKQLLNSRSKEN